MPNKLNLYEHTFKVFSISSQEKSDELNEYKKFYIVLNTKTLNYMFS